MMVDFGTGKNKMTHLLSMPGGSQDATLSDSVSVIMHSCH